MFVADWSLVPKFRLIQMTHWSCDTTISPKKKNCSFCHEKWLQTKKQQTGAFTYISVQERIIQLMNSCSKHRGYTICFVFVCLICFICLLRFLDVKNFSPWKICSWKSWFIIHMYVLQKSVDRNQYSTNNTSHKCSIYPKVTFHLKLMSFHTVAIVTSLFSSLWQCDIF